MIFRSAQAFIIEIFTAGMQAQKWHRVIMLLRHLLFFVCYDISVNILRSSLLKEATLPRFAKG